jgi:hypothetical protein
MMRGYKVAPRWLGCHRTGVETAFAATPSTPGCTPFAAHNESLKAPRAFVVSVVDSYTLEPEIRRCSNCDSEPRMKLETGVKTPLTVL